METKNTSRRTVVVTGAARGIGYAIAKAFYQNGDRVAIADLDLGKSQASAEEIGTDRIAGFAVDVTDRASVEKLEADVRERFGTTEVLVNNAGICPFIDVMDIDTPTFETTMSVNVTGPLHCTQVFASQLLKEERAGVMLFITSLSENFTGASQGDYAASKAGLRMLMKSFAYRLGPNNIRCSAVAPGMILTDMSKHHWEKPEPAAYIKKRASIGRIGYPEDIANACIMLASDKASYIHGTTVVVDGGYTVSTDA